MKKYRKKQFFTLLEVMVSMGVFALLMLALLYRVMKGPRYTDRLVAVNAINTMITASICLLSRLHRAPYLIDVALIYALLGFVGTTLFVRLRAAERRKEGKK